MHKAQTGQTNNETYIERHNYRYHVGKTKRYKFCFSLCYYAQNKKNIRHFFDFAIPHTRQMSLYYLKERSSVSQQYTVHMNKVGSKNLRLLTNYEYAESAKVGMTSIQVAAVKAGYVVNLITLGMHNIYIKRIWNGRVKKELSHEKEDRYYCRNLGKFSPSNEERSVVVNEQALSTNNQFLQLKHQSWFIASKSFEKQCIILMKQC